MTTHLINGEESVPNFVSASFLLTPEASSEMPNSTDGSDNKSHEQKQISSKRFIAAMAVGVTAILSLIAANDTAERYVASHPFGWVDKPVFETYDAVRHSISRTLDITSRVSEHEDHTLPDYFIGETSDVITPDKKPENIIRSIPGIEDFNYAKVDFDIRNNPKNIGLLNESGFWSGNIKPGEKIYIPAKLDK